MNDSSLLTARVHLPLFGNVSGRHLWTNEGFVSVGRDEGWEGALSQFDAVWTVDLAQLAGDRREGCVTSGAAAVVLGN